MRGQSRSRKGGGVEEGNFLVSVSDLMAGLLFVFIIMLMVFVISLRDAEESLLLQQAEKVEEIRRLRGVEEAKAQLLEELQARLLRDGVAVEIDLKHGLLRLPEDILFRSGLARVEEEGIEKLEKLARHLAILLPCYTSVGGLNCPDRSGEAAIEAVMIEGHTDDVPLRPGMRFKDNWELSTARAIRTYEELKRQEPRLESFRNTKDETLFGVAGYADSRRINLETTPNAREKNRRIDLRLLMAPALTKEEKREVLGWE